MTIKIGLIGLTLPSMQENSKVHLLTQLPSLVLKKSNPTKLATTKMVSVQTRTRIKRLFTFLNYPQTRIRSQRHIFSDLHLIHQRKVMVSLAPIPHLQDLLGSNFDHQFNQLDTITQHLPIHMEKKLPMFSLFLQATLITNRYHTHHRMEFPKIKIILYPIRKSI